MNMRYLVAGVLALAVAAFYASFQGGGESLVVYSDLLFVVGAGVCAFLAYFSAEKAGVKGSFALVRLGLFLGIFLWFLGDTAWGIFEIALQIEVPYPSLADVFYLAGYAPMIIAISIFLYSFRAAFPLWKLGLALVAGLLIAGLSFSVLLYPLSQSSSDLLTKSADLTYPILDTVLTVLALMMFLLYEGGTFAKPWMWISIGLMLTALGDILFSLGVLEGWYFSGHPSELLYMWGYIALGLGFDGQRQILE